MDKLKVLRRRFSSNLITIIILAFIVGLAAFLRFYQIDKLSFWSDELISAGMANLDFDSFVRWAWLRDVTMGLFNLLLWFWVRIFPFFSKEMIRILPVILSVLSIPAVFMLGKAMVTDEKKANLVGLMAAFFVAINAYHIQYAQELRSYSLVFLLSSLSTFLLIKAIEKPESKVRWLGYSVVIIASIYGHLFAMFILIAQMFSMLTLLRKKKFRFPYGNVIGSLIFILIILVPLMLTIYVQGNLYVGWIPKPTFNLILSFLVELAGNQGVLLLVLYLFLTALGIFIETNSEKNQKNVLSKWKIMLITNCLFLPIVLTLLISFVKPIFWPRYLLLVMPYLAILAALGISFMISLKGWRNRNYLVITILVVFILLSSFGIKNYFLSYNKEDFRGVADFMSKRCVNSLRVYYPFWIDNSVAYYNPSLKSQLVWFSVSGEPYSFKEIASHIPNKYSSACLMINLTHLSAAPKNQSISEIQSFLRKRFTNMYETNFYQFIVYVYLK